MTAEATARSDPVGARFAAVLHPARAEVADAGFLFALSALALLGFRTTYDGWSFLAVGLAGLLLGMAVAHAANALRQPVIVVAVMAVAVFFLLGGALALRSEAVAGILPSPSTIRELASMSVHGWKDLLTTLPPVDGTGPFLVIPYILGLMTGAGGFTMARRMRSVGWPVVAPAALLAVVILLGTNEPAAQLLQGAVFGIVAIGWIAERSMRVRAPVQHGAGRGARLAVAAGLIGVTVIGAAVVGPSLPGGGTDRLVLRDYVEPPFDISAYPSPLVGYRKYTEPAQALWDQTLFTVEGLPEGAYVRIATLDDYDGSVWGAANSSSSRTTPSQDQDGFERVGTSIRVASEGETATVRVTIGAAYATATDMNAWLPLAGAASSVEFDGSMSEQHAGLFRYNRGTDQGIVPDRLRDGDSYVVRTTIDDSALADPGEIPDTAQPYGSPALSAGASEFTSAKATEWSRGESSSVKRVMAVAASLVEKGAYSDGGGAESIYLPGHSLFRLSTNFLNDKEPVGNDEQYAAAFALMANQLGVPARVVVGAVPQANGVVQGRDVHTWVEVHLSDGSWRSVNRRVFMPPTTKHPQPRQQETQKKSTAAIVPPPNPARPPSAIDFSSQDNSMTNHAALTTQGAGWSLPAWVVTVLEWVGLPALAIGSVCALIVALKARRRRVRRNGGSPSERVAGGWVELLDHARDLGTSVPVGHTRREEAAMLAAYPVSALASRADATVFGPMDPTADDAARYWTEVDGARQAMDRDVGRWQRWRAAISLRSFRSRGPAIAP